MIHFHIRPSLRRLIHCLVPAIWSASASAVGLGPIQLHSGLGQPLRANIPLLAYNANELEPSCIKATVESADGAYLATPQVGLVSKGAPAAIVLSSKQALLEPALTLRVQLSCGGAINRDYQILLDPPQYELASSRERLPAASTKPEAPPAAGEPTAANADSAQPAAAPAPATHTPPARAARPRKPAAATPKMAAAVPKTAAAPQSNVRPQRSVLKVTNAGTTAAPIVKQMLDSAPAGKPAPELVQAVLPTAAPAAGNAAQPDLQMYALQAQMKDQLQALQKEMAALRQQNQLDQLKLNELRKTGVAPQVMQSLVGLLLLCLGAIGWLGWRLHSLKNNDRFE